MYNNQYHEMSLGKGHKFCSFEKAYKRSLKQTECRYQIGSVTLLSRNDFRCKFVNFIALKR